MNNDKAIIYCEDHGIYEFTSRGNILTYYSYFGSEAFIA